MFTIKLYENILSIVLHLIIMNVLNPDNFLEGSLSFHCSYIFAISIILLLIITINSVHYSFDISYIAYYYINIIYLLNESNAKKLFCVPTNL